MNENKKKVSRGVFFEFYGEELKRREKGSDAEEFLNDLIELKKQKKPVEFFLTENGTFLIYLVIPSDSGSDSEKAEGKIRWTVSPGLNFVRWRL
jgi:hypothetical protein